MSVERKPWTGDFDAMVKRRVIRVLVPHSKTSYFVERGQPRGIVYDAFKAYEDEINKKRGNLKVNVVFFPTTRDRLVPRSAGWAWRCRGRGLHHHHRARQGRRFRDSGHDKAGERDRGDGTAIAAADVARRPRRQGGLRPQVIELLGAPRAAQRASFKGEGKAADHSAAGARGSRRRGPSRDAQRRSLRHRASSTTTSWRSGRRSTRRSSRVPTWP